MKMGPIAYLILEKYCLRHVKLENSAAETDTVSKLGGNVMVMMTVWMEVMKIQSVATIIAVLMINLNARIIAVSPRDGFVMELMIVGAMKMNPIKHVQPGHAKWTSFPVEMGAAFPEHGCVTGKTTVGTTRTK